MLILRNRIIRRNERKFKEYVEDRLSQVDTTAIWYEEYIQHKEMLTKLLSSTCYWHGSGRYQYAFSGEHKYTGVGNEETKDILAEVLAQGGLKPKYDPWMEKRIHVSYTLSLANQWFYGRMYSHNYQWEQMPLQFEVAPVYFWYNLVIWFHVTEYYCKSLVRFIPHYVLSPSLKKQAVAWTSSFRSDSFTKKWKPRELLTTKSDIENNYGVLFGISSDIRAIPLMNEARFLESRTTDSIEFNNIKFMAVPYTNLVETLELFHQYSVDCHVIALEWLEVYMAELSFKDIVHGNRPYNFKPSH